MIVRQISNLGYRAIGLVQHLGNMGSFAGATARAIVTPPFRLSALSTQIYRSGVLSLGIIVASGLAVGMVLGLQGYHMLTRFGAKDAVGTMVALSLVRELGPVLTALLVTGRAGSATTAGIGAMVATEQLDGLRMLSIDPIHLVIKPRALALAIVMPLLTAMFIVAGILGGYIAGVVLMGLDAGSYMAAVKNAIAFHKDITGSMLKAVIFGILVSIIATYRGYHSAPTAEGVSAATTSTVVTGSVSVLVFDYIITAIWGV